MSNALWIEKALGWLNEEYQRLHETGYPSVAGGDRTLYGTIYGVLSRYYVGEEIELPFAVKDFVLGEQDPETGLFVGPELRDWSPDESAIHDREHLQMHLTAAVLPFCQQFGLNVKHPLREAHRFTEQDKLRAWLDARDLTLAWLEGNNLLFVGQFLVYLRDVERVSGAQKGLEIWFDWLDQHVDPRTGLWGTNGFCGHYDAAFGGYHQLLVYYYENRSVLHYHKLVDTILNLQHIDGGFSPRGGGGACEDVDCVDILVNAYKKMDYRRTEIRRALRRCLRQIMNTQLIDGGFPYKLEKPQSHMGIEMTRAGANVSCMFPTWFRIHTMALISEVLPDVAEVRGVSFRFNRALSMGWHRPWPETMKPHGWAGRLQEQRTAVKQKSVNAIHVLKDRLGSRLRKP